jgi:hypothetical protein
MANLYLIKHLVPHTKDQYVFRLTLDQHEAKTALEKEELVIKIEAKEVTKMEASYSEEMK